MSALVLTWMIAYLNHMLCDTHEYKCGTASNSGGDPRIGVRPVPDRRLPACPQITPARLTPRSWTPQGLLLLRLYVYPAAPNPQSAAFLVMDSSPGLLQRDTLCVRVIWESYWPQCGVKAPHRYLFLGPSGNCTSQHSVCKFPRI